MASTFVNLEIGKAFRVVSTEEARNLAPAYAPEVTDKYPQQLEAYKRMPDSVLFRVQQVEVNIRDEDMPGPTRYKVACSRCGQMVRDRREVIRDGGPLCKPCAEDAYYNNAKEITWPNMNWKPDSGFTKGDLGRFSRTDGTGQDAKIIKTNCD